MRITNQMKTSQIMQELTLLESNIFKASDVISSGSEVTKSSDDPSAALKIMNLKDSGDRRDQYLENITDGVARLSYAETQLRYAEDLITEARTLALTASNGATTDSDRSTSAARIDGMLEEMLTVANTYNENQYIFGGYNTQDPPYEAIYDPVTGDIIGVQDQATYMDGEIFVTTADGQEVRVNVPGKEVFLTGTTGDDGDVFQILIDLRDALLDGIDNDTDQQAEMDPASPTYDPLATYSEAEYDSLTVIQESLNRLDVAAETVRMSTARVGTDVQHLQDAEARHGDISLIEEEHLSEAEGGDLAEWYTKYETQMTSYEVAMSVASKVLSTSLLNFIS